MQEKLQVMATRIRSRIIGTAYCNQAQIIRRKNYEETRNNGVSEIGAAKIKNGLKISKLF